MFLENVFFLLFAKRTSLLIELTPPPSFRREAPKNVFGPFYFSEGFQITSPPPCNFPPPWFFQNFSEGGGEEVSSIRSDFPKTSIRNLKRFILNKKKMLKKQNLKISLSEVFGV